MTRIVLEKIENIEKEMKTKLEDSQKLNIEKLNANYDIIIVAKKKAGEIIETIKYQDIEKDLNRIFKNSKII